MPKFLYFLFAPEKNNIILKTANKTRKNIFGCFCKIKVQKQKFFPIIITTNYVYIKCISLHMKLYAIIFIA